MADYVKQSKPTELVLIHVGAQHVLDYFLRHPGQGARYATYAWNGSRRDGNAEYEEFLRLSDRPTMPLVSQMGLGGYLLELLRVADYKNGNPTFDLKSAFEEKAVKENVIIIGSIHGTRDTSVIEDLPSAESLKAAGFTSVTILIEGLPRRAAAYSPEEVNGVDDIATSYTTDVPGREFLARLKANHPAAYELLKSGKARFHPDSDAVVTKAKSWSSTLPVKFHSIGE